MADQTAWKEPQDVARLGAYRVLAELARGGMAAVFLAMREPRQQGVSRELLEIAQRGRYDDDALRIAQLVEESPDLAALKQIHAHLAHDPDFVAMLIDEARIASKLNHPNVVQIRECRLGEDASTNFIAMEYVAGESLSTLLKGVMTRGGRMSPAMAASIGADVAGALHAAHELTGERGELLELVHRDVSPQNVIVRYDGRVKLTDFGVAKAVGRLQRTQPGEIKGKLAYMAPEQAYGKAVDRRSDVYSLGVVIYEVALGRRLFGGRSDAETVRNIIQHNVPAPRSIDPNFPASFEEILMGMLQADPAHRFQSAGAVERALRAFVQTAGEPEVAPRLGELARTLDPNRYRAKTELVVRELATYRAPMGDANDPSESRTLVVSSRPPRVATQAAPKARGSAPASIAQANATLVDSDSAATIPLAEQARAAIASLTPPAPVAQPVGERTRVASDPYGPARTPSMHPPANPAASYQQTMVSELPQHVMQQVQAAQQAQQTPVLPPAMHTPAQPQGQPQPLAAALTSQPPYPPVSMQPVLSQPPAAPSQPVNAGGSRRGLWAVLLVGSVLLLLAAGFVVTRLR